MMFVYEPEAAALYCRYQKLHAINDTTNDSDGKGDTALQKGRKVLVFDMGGGTTDISVIEIKSEKEIHIVERASGGPFGGTHINENFCQWLDEVFGEDNMKKIRTEHRSDYMQLIRDFEQKKRPIDPKKDKSLFLQIPTVLKQLAEDTWKCKLEDQFRKAESRYPCVQVKKRGKLFFPSSFFVEHFILPISKIVLEDMKRILQKHGDISSVLAVGGLAQSAAMTTEIRKYAKDIPVFVPFDSSVAILNGAVLYGHDNNVIKARICKYSYGIQTMRPFEEGDDKSKKVQQEGKVWCKHCFRALYHAGDMIKLGDVNSYELEEYFNEEGRKNKQFKPIRCILFRSESENPRYVTDNGCEEHGTIEIEVPENGFPVHYKCTVELEFAGTEIIARLKDNQGIKTIRVDFLN
ncbi:heat shock 70 kDa protein 12A-like [Ostrea edulis]|uniref:heat shock 70 kDa protein 12A-like n=1 Tax=Ostrea edulis TaxID=37623 RepID=UPI0024AF6414|nr:heat shock 70 kDa protein 12A-like [Ostrea edulis]